MTFNVSLVTLVALLFCSTGVAQGICKRKPNQPCFAEDDRAFNRAEPLSREVITVMLRTFMGEPDIRDLLEITPRPEAPGSLFNAIPIKLSSSNARWMLAVGTAPPTTGADNGHFWLIDLSGPRPRAKLLAPANYVDLLESRHGGYRDVQTEWCSPDECIDMLYQNVRGRYRRVQVSHALNARQ
jgi:hypothetical protein